MKKILFLLFACIISGVYAEGDTKNIKITQQDEKYIVAINDNEGKIIYKLEYNSTPILTYYNDVLTGITVSLGNPNSQTIFYDQIKKIVSTAFENVFAVEADKQLVVYCENNKIAVKNIFSKEKPFFIIRDYSPTASIFSAINEIKFIQPDKLQMSYMVGPNYTDKEEIIDIKRTTNGMDVNQEPCRASIRN
ncbi:MAG: hypothetical protein GX654_00450 [Desulfatiglans sp.]|nr:hypothetical protein [Desulfatiglans sp.]